MPFAPWNMKHSLNNWRGRPNKPENQDEDALKERLEQQKDIYLERLNKIHFSNSLQHLDGLTVRAKRDERVWETIILSVREEGLF